MQARQTEGGETVSGLEMERAMRRGKEHGLSSTERLVYLAIAFRKYHKTGKCNPAAEQIMIDTDLGRSAVFHALKAIETKGLLIRKSKTDPLHPWRKASNEYRFPEEASPPRALDRSADGAGETGASSGKTSAPSGPASPPSTERPVHDVYGNKVLEKKELTQAFKKGENPAKSKPKGRSFLKSKSHNQKPTSQGSDAMDKLIADAIAKHSLPMESLEEHQKKIKQQLAVLMAAEKLKAEKATQDAADAKRAEYFDESGRPTQKLQAKLRDQGLPEWEIGTESSVPF